MFLSADDERPEEGGRGGPGRGGQPVHLRDRQARALEQGPGPRAGEATLKNGDFTKIAIADPVTAPYGAAAVQAMQALGVYDRSSPRSCRATTSPRPISSSRPATPSSASSRSSQVVERRRRLALGGAGGPARADPAGRGAAQDGRGQRGGQGLPGLPARARRPRAIIAKYGYGRAHPAERADVRRDGPVAADPADARAGRRHHHHPARRRHADRLVAGALGGALEGGRRGGRGAAARPAADRARLLPADRARAERPGRLDRGPRRRPHAGLHLRGPGDRLGDLFAALRGAADPQRLRGDRRASARGRGDAARLAAGTRSGPSRCRWPGPAS